MEIDGDVGLVSDYIPGPTLWEALIEDPMRGVELGRLLAELQRTVFAITPTFALPRATDRLRAKLIRVADQFGLEVAPMCAWVAQARPVGLCHGDLHPYNVILSPDGPVLVDWFDVAIGPVNAEIARTVLLLDERPPIDGAAELRASYLDSVRSAGDLGEDQLQRWMIVQRAARMAEGFGHDPAELHHQINAITWR